LLFSLNAFRVFAETAGNKRFETGGRENPKRFLPQIANFLLTIFELEKNKMDGITPSPAVTKIGSLLLVFAIALFAVWAINNNASLSKWTAKKAA
jgi:hypothetical protein